MTDDRFDNSRQVKAAKMKHLKELGKGNSARRSDHFTPDEIQKLYDYGQLGKIV